MSVVIQIFLLKIYSHLRASCYTKQIMRISFKSWKIFKVSNNNDYRKMGEISSKLKMDLVPQWFNLHIFVCIVIWDKVFKSRPSKTCRMHPFKKLILYGLLTDHITLILSKDVFHKFYLVHSLILCFILHWCLEHHSNFAHSFSFLTFNCTSISDSPQPFCAVIEYTYPQNSRRILGKSLWRFAFMWKLKDPQKRCLQLRIFWIC